jgi:small subunit ribosomal protein S6
MPLRRYEAMYILDPETTDEALEPIVEKYKKVVTDMGGIVGETGKWDQGRRRLAYPIRGQREGLYILMNFEADTEVPKELDRVFKISDEIFRHIIVRYEEPKERPTRKKRAALAEAALTETVSSQDE